jgi:transposase
VLKAKVAELQQRLFGRKSERARRAAASDAAVESGIGRRARGQQPGSAGHGRKLRKNLPVVETVLDLCEQQKRCPLCGLAWESFGQPHTSEQIEWEVRLFRRRTIRPKYRRPSGCHCQAQRPDIISAPLAPALIPKGILAPSFLSEVLLLKFLVHLPSEPQVALPTQGAGLHGEAELVDHAAANGDLLQVRFGQGEILAQAFRIDPGFLAAAQPPPKARHCCLVRREP